MIEEKNSFPGNLFLTNRQKALGDKEIRAITTQFYFKLTITLLFSYLWSWATTNRQKQKMQAIAGNFISHGDAAV
jgi:hypothetical protein